MEGEEPELCALNNPTVHSVALEEWNMLSVAVHQNVKW